jgi:hypothetical protein
MIAFRNQGPQIRHLLLRIRVLITNSVKGSRLIAMQLLAEVKSIPRTTPLPVSSIVKGGEGRMLADLVCHGTFGRILKWTS